MYTNHKNIVRAAVATVSVALTATMATTPSLALTPEPITVELVVDGETAIVQTIQETVADVLEENEVEVEADDAVSPEPDAPVTDGDQVEVVTAKNIRLKVGKNPVKVRRLAVNTVNEVLAETNTTLSKADRLSPSRATTVRDNSLVTVTRVKYKKFNKRTKIKFKTIKKKSNRLYKGERKVSKNGRKGALRTTYEKKFVNGKAVQTKKVAKKVVRKPRKKVVLIGTKKRETVSGVWKALAQCESGGNPNIVSSNGLYHGLFQFSVATWHGVGGSGLPSRASVGEQLKRAKILQARSGWGQWPHCSSKLGLR